MLKGFASTSIRARSLWRPQQVGVENIASSRFISPTKSRQCSRQFCNAKPTPAKETAESAETAIVLTPYQKVTATARGGLYLGLAAVATASGYFIIRELFPSRMNPNSLFNEALDQIRSNPDVADRLGTPIRGYGRDHGGHREGRRNFIENVSLKDSNGTPRLRIKFNMKGPHGHAFGFAEAKKGMSSGEWVYLIVQITRTGETITVVDNRQILQAESQDEQDALRQLLQGGK